jgi:antagonist of KipI
MNIEVLRPGLLTSIQDLGRYGYQKHGVIVSGAMDSFSLRLANLLVGNDEGAAALEITLMGPSLRIEQDILMAITGGNLSPTVAGVPIPMWRPIYLKGGSILKFGECKVGCRSYLSIAGGYKIPEVLGSASTYLRAGLGGFQGRALQKGDVLQSQSPQEKSLKIMQQLATNSSFTSFVSTAWYIGRGHIPQNSQPITIRMMRGRQFDQFTTESIEQLLHSAFRVTPQSDRMGYRLSGAALKLANPKDMISEAIALGTVQVPPDGNPIILLADRQTAGGYPKIAQIATVDVAVVAQSKPGANIWFQEISLVEAEELYLAREEAVKKLRKAIALQLQL